MIILAIKCQLLLTMEVVTINVLYVMAQSHSVADDQPFHDDETFSDPFVMPGSPGSASVSSSSEDENVDKQAAALLTVYSGSGSSSAITGKKTQCIPNMW